MLKALNKSFKHFYSYNHPFRLKYKYGEAAATIIKQIAIG
jgi:hypothetical protein